MYIHDSALCIHGQTLYIHCQTLCIHVFEEMAQESFHLRSSYYTSYIHCSYTNLPCIYQIAILCSIALYIQSTWQYRPVWSCITQELPLSHHEISKFTVWIQMHNVHTSHVYTMYNICHVYTMYNHVWTLFIQFWTVWNMYMTCSDMYIHWHKFILMHIHVYTWPNNVYSMCM